MNEHFDPRLDELIERLRSTPERDPEAVARGQARFLAEMEPLFEPATAQPFWRRLWHRLTIQRSKELTNMTTPKRTFAITSVLALIAILVVLLGGASATAYAAQSALPGETLYPVKTGLEQTQVRLSRDAAGQAELHLAFAQRRLDEIAGLIEQGRFDEIQLAAAEFETQVQQAIDALQAVSLGDPLRARELAGQIASSLSNYARTLSGMLSSVPEPVRPVMEQAINTAQAGDSQAQVEQEFSGPIEALDGQSWTVAGIAFQVNQQTELKGSFSLGDQVKVHAFVALDGSLIAREIEPAAGPDLNANDDHDNDNLNANDDHSNDNDDLNGNDDHGNDNDDLNGNDDHGDDHLNSNDDHGNGNLNSNDDGGSSSQGGETRFIGVVQSISANTWVVSGISLQITPQTDIRDAIRSGDRIEVRAITAPDGELVALRLRIDDSGSSSSSNNSGSGSGASLEGNSNTNSNSNDDSGSGNNTNSNSNDDSGSASNTNASSNDNSGSASNTNSNSNDDSSGGSNSNTNSNSNDNSGGSSGSNSNDDHSGSGGGSGSGSGSGSGGSGSNSNDDNSSGHG